jgi:hypothetical protein
MVSNELRHLANLLDDHALPRKLLATHLRALGDRAAVLEVQAVPDWLRRNELPPGVVSLAAARAARAGGRR